MAQQIINVGNVANDGQGDQLRTAFIKTNDNFTELYGIGGVTGIANGSSNIAITGSGPITFASANVANVMVLSNSGAVLNGTVTANTINTTTYVKTTATVFASLPAAGVAGAGARAFITDSTSQTFGDAAAGGGSYAVPVWCNGSAWYVG